MGLSGIGFTELLLILLIVMLIFGTKRFKTIGSDLGSAIRGFRSALNSGEREDGEPKPSEASHHATPAASVSPDVRQPAPDRAAKADPKDQA